MSEQMHLNGNIVAQTISLRIILSVFLRLEIGNAQSRI